MDVLDRDTLSSVLSFLAPHELGRCARVCKWWNEVVSNNNTLWEPFVRDMASFLCPSDATNTAMDLLRSRWCGASLRHVYVTKCWINANRQDIVSVERVPVNVNTVRAAAVKENEENENYCVHVVRNMAGDRINARRAATEAHKRALSGCSNPKKRKLNEMKGKKCYLDRTFVY